MDSVRDTIVSMSGYKVLDLHDISPTNRKLSIQANEVWRKMYYIVDDVETYYGASLGLTHGYLIL